MVSKDGGTDAGTSLAAAIQFSPPLAADLCTDNACAQYVTSSSSNCPGAGLASPAGRLCFYPTDDSANLTYDGTRDPRGTGFAVRRYGTILSFTTAAPGQQGFSQGTWRLTAP